MPFQPDHQHHVRRVFLPSGKAIEVVYFEDVGAQAPAAAATPAELNVCPACACEHVHPVDWVESGPERWDVLLRCPNCERQTRSTCTRLEVDHIDEQLDRGTEAMVGELKRLMQANMADGIERFVAALGADQIVPEDF